MYHRLQNCGENFNYSENTLFTSIQSTSTDFLSDHGYETSNIGLSIGTAFEQYENIYFSPQIDAAFEDIEVDSTASAQIQKMEGNFFNIDLYFGTTLENNATTQSGRKIRSRIHNQISTLADVWV